MASQNRSQRRLKLVEVLAIVGLLVTILQFIVGTFGKLPTWTYGVAYVVFIAALLTLVFYEAHFRRHAEVNLEREKANAQSQRGKADALQSVVNRCGPCLEAFHPIFHSIRDNMLDLLEKRVPESVWQSNQQAFGEKITTETAQLFTRGCAHACAACIKLCVLPHDRPEHVMTFARDSASGRKRYSDDERRLYRIDRNTDFHLIMTGQSRWFYSGDLRREGDHYANERSDWQKYYLCTAVVPIMRPAGLNYEAEILGFLCIDSLKVDAFPERESVETLACIADSLYATFKYYFLLTDGPPPSG